MSEVSATGAGLPVFEALQFGWSWRGPPLLAPMAPQQPLRVGCLQVRLLRRVTVQSDYSWSKTVTDCVATQTFPGVGSYTALRGMLAR